MTPRRGLVAVVVAAALLLTGCAAGQDAAAPDASSEERAPLTELTPLADPRAWEGPGTATLASSVIEPVLTDPTQELPVTVVSHDLGGDVEVTVEDTSRVVAMDLSGSIAATVWGLGFGDRLVGRDITTTFPGTEDLPVITGSGHAINVEAVISLKPTLVLTDGSIGPTDVVLQLRDVGIDVVYIPKSTSFDGAVTMAADVAAVLGAPEAGELLSARVADEIAQTRAAVEALAPADPADRLRMVFLYLRGSAGVYYLFGEESGADVLIEGLAGVDVAGELGWSGMRPLTDEAMVAADPDLILVMSSGLESVGGVDGLLADKPAIALTTAGKHRRIVDMDDGQILSFGPRTAEVLDALARVVYAPEGSGS